MKELVRSNDVVFISWLLNALEQAGIYALLLDQHMSSVEGSLGILPRRILVSEEALPEARAILAAGPDLAVVEGIVVERVANTADSLLDGAVVFYQPSEGYRAAIDPVLMAAAVPAVDNVLDLGCGAGAAALCLAKRVPGCQVTGLEIDPALVTLARTNAAENGFGGRMEIVLGNVVAPPEALHNRLFDAVMLNPPHRARGTGTASAQSAKQRANEEEDADLAAWVGAALSFLAHKGTVVILHRADRLPEVIALLESRCGETEIVPLWPKAGRAAKRVIVRARKGVRAGCSLWPGLILHESDGRYTAAADSVLRRAAPLPVGER
jgi:tRNA1(Val) A37 N6-methylase TrmN6